MDELTLRLAARTAVADGVVVLDFRDAGGRPLPRFEPGAHVELLLPSGLRRHYSLCGDPAESDRYQVAVGLAEPSHGGSRYLHEALAVGDALPASAPRNHFPLVRDAPSYAFIAGGIGITPILPMLSWCAANGRSWSLLYLLRCRRRGAFLAEVEQFGPAVRVHADDEHGGPIDITEPLREVADDAHVYCCGPAALMEAVARETAGRPAGTVHFEWFTPRPDAPRLGAGDGGFTVVLARRGLTIEVPADKSILETLESRGIDVPFSCREGMCATCETVVLEGIPDHRDQILTEDERAEGRVMMICCSRAKSAMLMLDL